MDIWLSLRMTSRSFCRPPTCCMASKVMPEVIAPSPTTQTTLWCCSARSRAGVTRIERVVDALFALAEAAEPTVLPQRMEVLAPARQQLVSVGLVAGVRHDPILRRVQKVMQRQGE